MIPNQPIREVFDFPTILPLKIVGRNDGEFVELVHSLFLKHVEAGDITSLTRRPSRGDNYISVTVTFTASSREQLNALYAELSGEKRILMVI